jgi:hypothetical protein
MTQDLRDDFFIFRAVATPRIHVWRVAPPVQKKLRT